MTYSLAGKRVWVAGHRGMAGSAIARRLKDEGCEILTAGHAELDLRRQAEVERWVAERRPQAVFLAAAKVGGILANNSRPAEFLYDNLAIETNVIHAAHTADESVSLTELSAAVDHYVSMATHLLRQF